MPICGISNRAETTRGNTVNLTHDEVVLLYTRQWDSDAFEDYDLDDESRSDRPAIIYADVLEASIKDNLETHTPTINSLYYPRFDARIASRPNIDSSAISQISSKLFLPACTVKFERIAKSSSWVTKLLSNAQITSFRSLIFEKLQITRG